MCFVRIVLFKFSPFLASHFISSLKRNNMCFSLSSCFVLMCYSFNYFLIRRTRGEGECLAATKLIVVIRNTDDILRSSAPTSPANAPCVGWLIKIYQRMESKREALPMSY